MPSINLFASRLNAQITSYVSWQSDPSAKFIDALSINWRVNLNYSVYFHSLIDNCLQKLELNATSGIFVLPLWPTQRLFTRAIRILVAKPLFLPQRADLLRLPNNQTRHSVAKKMRLIKESFRTRGLLSDSIAIILKSWREGSRKQYRGYLKRWVPTL